VYSIDGTPLNEAIAAIASIREAIAERIASLAVPDITRMTGESWPSREFGIVAKATQACNPVIRNRDSGEACET
jgi:hypothetical protein